MIRLVNVAFDSSHPLGVSTISCSEVLVQVVRRHVSETGQRYCRFFAVLPQGIRLERWVALSPDEKSLLVRTEFGDVPTEVQLNEVEDCRSLGRFMKSGRLYYDPLELEMPSDARAMQRFS